MAGEFLMLYEAIKPEKIRKIALLSDEAIKLWLSNYFLELNAGLKISKKQNKKEFAKFLIEKGVNKQDILKITNLSKTTLWRAKNEKN